MSCLSWCVNLRKPDKIPSSNVKMSEDFSKSPSVVKALRGSSPHKLHRLPEQQHRTEQISVLQDPQYTSFLSTSQDRTNHSDLPQTGHQKPAVSSQ